MIRKRFLGILVLSLVLFSVIPTESFAYDSSGVIMDSQQRKIVGLWVEVENGDSGWAQWHYNSGSQYTIRWNFDTQNKRYKLHIGIGGSPDNWQKTVHSDWIKAQGYNFTDCVIHAPFLFGEDRVQVTYR